MTGLPNSQACERNRGPILEVLEEEFAGRRVVLEIGSGTGQHAVHFAAAMPELTWQTSDLPRNHDAILGWLEHAGLENARPPIVLDVEQPDRETLAILATSGIDAAFSANTAHIMRFEAVRRMFELVGGLLPDDGVFCLYGPFNFNGRFSSDSNAEFDASLRQHSGEMGIRDLEALDELGARAGLSRARLYAMPANNYIAVWVKSRNIGAASGTGREGGP